MIENASYKFGFSGIRNSDDHMTLTRLKVFNKLKLVSRLKNFTLNPYYINESILDTAAAYWHTFMTKDDFLWLYHYIDWLKIKLLKQLLKNMTGKPHQTRPPHGE